MAKFADAFIFDMDGTLWDAVDSYTRIWDVTLEQNGIKRPPVTREELIGLMGRHLEDILATLISAQDVTPKLLENLNRNEREMMPVLGGQLYPGVPTMLEELSARVPVFMVSNCGSHGLVNFLEFNGFTNIFRDTLSHGQTGLPKAENIKLLQKRYNLKNPYYVGDTETDAQAAQSAGAGMVWCSYGFGTASHADFTIDSPQALLYLPIVPPASAK